MENLPTVSIIILNYNSGSYLKKCIESLLRLEYPKLKIEIIVADNNSTDNSLDTIQKYLKKKY